MAANSSSASRYRPGCTFSMRSHGAGAGLEPDDRVAQAGRVDALHHRGESCRSLGMTGTGVVQQELRVDREQDRHVATLSPGPPEPTHCAVGPVARAGRTDRS